MKIWNRIPKMLVLSIIFILISTVSVMAGKQDTTPNADIILTDDNLEEGTQSVYIGLDTIDQTISDAVLQYQDGNEEREKAAEKIAGNYILFLLDTAELNRSLNSINVTVDGENYAVDLSPAKEGEQVDIDDVTLAEAETGLTSDEVEKNIIVSEDGVTGSQIEEAVGEDQITSGKGRSAARSAVNRIVVLDPGHGKKGSGANFTYNGVTYYEDEINLKISKYTKEALERYSGVTVYMTRTDASSTPTLEWRVNYAVSKGAEILVSQHINYAGEDNRPTTANGATVIVARTGRYNNGIAQEGQDLAKSILEELYDLGLAERGLSFRDSESNTKYPDGSLADYYGIVAHSMRAGLPGIIVEHAFINNEHDFKTYLSSDEKLKALGEADARGIANYLGISSGEWKQIDGNWYYFNSDGTMKTNSWVGDYYVGANGIMLTNQWIEGYYVGGDGKWIPGYVTPKKNGWISEGNSWYYYRNNQKATGWLLDGSWYYLNSNGVMATGWVQANGKWYYCNSSGAMLTGWVKDGNSWYYCNDDGVMQIGWLKDGPWYYLNGNGSMAVGWIYAGGSWYYCSGSGAMLTGWVKDGNSWYYCNGSGAMLTGWVRDGSSWYYCNGSGVMLTGWVWDRNCWYYCSGNGAMLTGWVKVGGSWYYCNGSGAMLTGWIKDENTWYYCNGSGVMAVDTWVGNYYVNSSGAWTQTR